MELIKNNTTFNIVKLKQVKHNSLVKLETLTKNKPAIKKKCLIQWILILFLVFTFGSVLYSQNNFIGNIDVPDDNKGIMPEDIVYAANVNKVYVYGTKGILVFNKNGVFLSIIKIEQKKYGQNSFFPELIKHSVFYNAMAYNSDDHELYVITPTLNVISINTQEDIITGVRIPKPQTITWSYLESKSIIRYDERNNYIYLIIKKPEDPDCYIGIFNANNGSPIGNDKFFPNIYDIAINKIHDIFYLSRKDNIEIYDVYDLEMPICSIPSTGKNGKFVYIIEGNITSPTIHKIVCLPHLNNSLSTPYIYIIDGDDYSSYEYIESPAHIVKDAIYNHSDHSFILGLFPDIPNDPDIYIYDFENLNNEPVTFCTNGFPDEENNYPVWITPGPGETPDNFFFSKVHEIVELKESGSNNYSWEPHITGFNNYFHKGISTSGSSLYTFIIKMIQAGIHLQAQVGVSPPDIITGSIVNRGFYNNLSKMAYFYTDKGIVNSSIYVYNEALQSLSEHNISDPVANCIHNPFTNDIIVSHKRFTDNVTVFDYNMQNTIAQLDVSDEYGGNMFVSPKKKLYITTGMHNDAETTKIHVFSAETYNPYNPCPVIDITNYVSQLENFHAGLVADFCYNPINNCVYIGIGYDGYTSPDQIPEINDGKRGLMIKIMPDFTVQEFFFENMIVDFLYMNNYIYLACMNHLWRYNCYNDEIEEINFLPQYSNCFCELECNDYGDIYALNLFTESYQKQKIHVINSKSLAITETILLDDKAFFNSMEFNSVDGVLYAYSPINFNSRENKLYCIDTKNDFDITSVYLENKFLNRYSFFRGVLNDIIIDHQNNQLFLPNGGQSNISKVSDQGEVIYISGEGYSNWLSFPRLESQSFSMQTQLEQLFPDPEILTLEGKTMQNNNFIYEAEYDITLPDPWNIDLEIENLYSNRGYKLSVNFLEGESYGFMPLNGERCDPETDVYIYFEDENEDTIENWTGYFIPDAQHPRDAFPEETLEALELIKGRAWFCFRLTPCNHENNGIGYVNNSCLICSGGTSIDYADMIALETSSDQVYRWNEASGPPPAVSFVETTYFTFEETSDYLPIVVELDNNDTPLEVGAFIGDSCIGASTVLNGDTLVFIRAYTQGTYADSITFEKYYGSGKAAPLRIREYYVLDKKTGLMKKRAIRLDERKSYYYVSFKEKHENQYITPAASLSCRPNPFSGHCSIIYEMPYEATVIIEAIDMFGRQVDVIESGHKVAGKYSLKWNTNNAAGVSLNEGVYIIRLNTGKEVVKQKVVLVR